MTWRLIWEGSLRIDAASVPATSCARPSKTRVAAAMTLVRDQQSAAASSDVRCRNCLQMLTVIFDRSAPRVGPLFIVCGLMSVAAMLRQQRSGVASQTQFTCVLFQAKLAIVLLDNPIAFTGGVFKFLAIHDLHCATGVLDDLLLLQNPRCRTHGGSIRA
jgi:hypothetical protein